MHQDATRASASRRPPPRKPPHADEKEPARLDHTTPLTPHVITHLQRSIGNQAVNRLIAQQTAPRIQRRIKVKGGGIHGAEQVRGPDPEALKKAKRHAELFLVNSQVDLAALEAGRPNGIYLLPPAKHMIGETHIHSRFQEAVNNWGWGAQRMAEKISTHPRIRQARGQAALTVDPRAPEYQAQPLENTVAKHLGILNVTQYYVAKLKEFKARQDSEEALSEAEKQHISNRLAKGLKNNLGTLEEIKNSLVTYRKSSPGWYAKKYKGAAEFPGLAEIRTLESIKEKSNLLHSTNNNMDYASTLRDVTYAFRGLDRLERMINAMVDACLAIAKGDDLTTYNRVDMDTRRDQFTNAPTTPTDPLREHYMGQNIRNNLGIPGLVKVGSGHIDGLEAQEIPHALGYEDYSEFLEDTEASRVFDNIDDF